MIKSEAMTQFGYSDQDVFDTLLLNLDIDPDASELTDNECDRIRQHIAEMGASKALPASENSNANVDIGNSDLAVTDDDVLDLAETTGVDLDVVMSAAAHVEDLEALVKWVEAYQELESEQTIKESAKQQFNLDQLRKKETELTDRLNSALTKTKPDVKKIRQRLGVKVPASVSRLGTWNGKADDANEPDFLKKARQAFSTRS
ncbi:hypothetical protein H6F96_19610 [Microcoleus sp. FACHB-53]|nr:hypothetical protein [Microcoleus sp. FACHB-53]